LPRLLRTKGNFSVNIQGTFGEHSGDIR
jgi:hypothetical protein